MLTIKKIEDLQNIKAYTEAHASAHDFTNEQVMALTEGDAITGLGSLSLIGYKVYLNFIHAEEPMLCHGLAKALLNMADLRGIKTVYGNNPELTILYNRLRFQQENDEYTVSLENYFRAEHH